MCRISLELDDDVVALLRQDDQPLDQTARDVIVMVLNRRGVISGGTAAALLGTDRLAFILRAANLGVPYFTYTIEDGEAKPVAGDKV